MSNLISKTSPNSSLTKWSTRRQRRIFAAISVTLIAITLFTSAPANAGIYRWFTGFVYQNKVQTSAERRLTGGEMNVGYSNPYNTTYAWGGTYNRWTGAAYATGGAQGDTWGGFSHAAVTGVSKCWWNTDAPVNAQPQLLCSYKN